MARRAGRRASARGVGGGRRSKRRARYVRAADVILGFPPAAGSPPGTPLRGEPQPASPTPSLRAHGHGDRSRSRGAGGAGRIEEGREERASPVRTKARRRDSIRHATRHGEEPVPPGGAGRVGRSVRREKGRTAPGGRGKSARHGQESIAYYVLRKEEHMARRGPQDGGELTA
ncbi:hypothetical protein BDY21DRAFT_359690 [Lineolata rhizophorae]|uniref:Uncharacterized protein n=1 Tax=Lineolata rhizophorae TaxID=578093 RepID=A0A6A6NKW1_9PEZI|nr:hypothetical protein BDY21DRAFT_359690 [Lineolata rhizophorae]